MVDTEEGPAAAGGEHPPDGGLRTLRISEVTAHATTIRCMGRTYRVVAQDGAVVFTDVTDITRPAVLGTATPAGDGLWEVTTDRGTKLPGATDLLPTLVALRRSHWPA